MSLVVGEIHDDRLSIVADTKIIFRDDPTRTRRVFNYALPKLVILRDDLVAGYAGQGPDRLLRVLVGTRHDEVSTILQTLATIPNASFIVGALDPGPRLWHVTDGHVFDRSTIGRGWVGDQRAYEHFQRRYHEWPDETDRAFRLMSSMQWLLSFSPVASVGGYLTRVVTSDGRFRFVADPSTVGPWRMQVDRVTVDHSSARLDSPSQTAATRPATRFCLRLAARQPQAASPTSSRRRARPCSSMQTPPGIQSSCGSDPWLSSLTARRTTLASTSSRRRALHRSTV